MNGYPDVNVTSRPRYYFVNYKWWYVYEGIGYYGKTADEAYAMYLKHR